jgi:hypothetical protein
MKKTVYIFLAIFALFSCKKEDNRIPRDFEGKWSLVEYMEGRQSEVYFPEDIIWEFNKYDELVVSIDTIISPTSQLPIKTPGVYEFVANKGVMSVEGMQYTVETENESLVLDHNSSANGILIRFVKIQE